MPCGKPVLLLRFTRSDTAVHRETPHGRVSRHESRPNCPNSYRITGFRGGDQMSFEIRPATPEDRDRIVLFNQALARETEGRMLDRDVLTAGVSEMLADPVHGQYFVAEDGDEIVGQLAVTREWSDWRNGDIWWIQSVYIAKEHRRKGVYQALHGHVREVARAAGVIGLRLYVERDNEGAQNTYAALGMHRSPYVMYEEFWPKT